MPTPADNPADPALQLGQLSEVDRERALTRYAVLAPHLHDGVPLTRAAAAARVPLRTVQRWLTRYRAAGLVGLARTPHPAPRTPRADRGRRSLPEQLVLLIEGLALSVPPPLLPPCTAPSSSSLRCRAGPRPPTARSTRSSPRSIPGYARCPRRDQAVPGGIRPDPPAHRRTPERHLAGRPHPDRPVIRTPSGKPARPWLTAPAAPPVAPTSAAPSAAATTAPSAPAVYVPQPVTGSGATVVDLTTPIQLGIMTLDCSRCRGQVTVKSDAEIDSDLVYVSDGKYVGKRWLGVRGGTTSRIQVTATGPWVLTVADASSVQQYPAAATVSGNGDDVVLFTTGPKSADVSYTDPQGYHDLDVQVAMDGLVTLALPVNVTGSFSGTVLFPGNGTNAALMQIRATGKWTVVARP